jgi:hypothetical protein
MTFTTAIRLHLLFTVSAWIRADSFAANNTIFSKDDNGGTPNVLFRAYVDTAGKLAATVAQPASHTANETKTGANAITLKTWAFVVISLKLDTGATFATVNFMLNGTASDDLQSFSAGHYYIDSNTAYPTYIGAYRTATSTYSEPFLGFMFNIYVENSYLTGVASGHYIASCDAACTDGCATISTECLLSYDFDKQPNNSTVCNTGCTIGCRHAEICASTC